MRRLITLFFLVFTLSGVAFAQQMSDDQVVQYVKSAQQMGKNQVRYLQPIITQYFIDNKSEIWLLFLIAHSKR